MKPVIQLLFFLILPTFALAQNSHSIIYGLWSDSTKNTNHLSTLNQHTGDIHILDTTSIAKGYSYGTAVLDSANDRYNFLGVLDSTSEHHLFSIDINSGSIISDTLFTKKVKELNLLSTTNEVYGMCYDDSSQTHLLCKIDMVSGSINTIGGADSIGNVQTGSATLNPVTGEYIITGTYPNSNQTRHFVLDISTGKISTDTPAVHTLRMLRIHPTTQIIYGLYDSATNHTLHLATLNPYSGNVDILNSNSEVNVLSLNTGFIDPHFNSYTFIGRKFGSSTDLYISMNLTDGTELQDTTAHERLVGIKYYNTLLLTSTNTDPNRQIFRVGPNPFLNEFTITGEFKDANNVNISLFNSQGKEEDIAYQVISNHIRVDTKQLSPGMYIYQVWDGATRVHSGSIIKN